MSSCEDEISQGNLFVCTYHFPDMKILDIYMRFSFAGNKMNANNPRLESRIRNMFPSFLNLGITTGEVFAF